MTQFSLFFMEKWIATAKEKQATHLNIYVYDHDIAFATFETEGVDKDQALRQQVEDNWYQEFDEDDEDNESESLEDAIDERIVDCRLILSMELK